MPWPGGAPVEMLSPLPPPPEDQHQDSLGLWGGEAESHGKAPCLQLEQGFHGLCVHRRNSGRGREGQPHLPAPRDPSQQVYAFYALLHTGSFPLQRPSVKGYTESKRKVRAEDHCESPVSPGWPAGLCQQRHCPPPPHTHTHTPAHTIYGEAALTAPPSRSISLSGEGRWEVVGTCRAPPPEAGERGAEGRGAGPPRGRGVQRTSKGRGGPGRAHRSALLAPEQGSCCHRNGGRGVHGWYPGSTSLAALGCTGGGGRDPDSSTCEGHGPSSGHQ